MEKRWLLFATAAIIAAGLYPPWEEKADIPYRLHFERSVGYSFLWSPPGSSVAEDYPGMTSISVDGQRLLIEWFLIGLAAAVGTLAGQRGCLGPQDPATTTDERGEGVARFPASPAAGGSPRSAQ
jgi:hypothetical protein